MRLARFLHEGDVAHGILHEDGMQPIAWEYREAVDPSRRLPLGECVMLAPVVPTKIIGIGLNYREHADEVGMDTASEPTIFLKAPSTVLDPGGTVIYPERSTRLDYEAELAVVIGREAKDVAVKEALGHVLGYTCGLDMTARDLQAADGQWTRSKNFDTFCPLGPWIETDLDPSDLEVTMRVNGAVRQHSRTAMMIFGVAELVSFLSGIMTLCPGDVIMSGTPAGIGPVQRGDELEVEVEGIGVLSCSVGVG